MKKLFFLAAAFCMHAAQAQKITLRFEGNVNAANEQNFTVDVDGQKYYSYNAEAASAGRARQMVLNNFSAGAHNLSVYRNNTNNTISNNGGTALYNNSFQLRNGYDMIIAIRRNGEVTFTEKRNNNASISGNASGQAAMSDAQFNTLLQSVKAKWSQTSRYTALKSAFSGTNYFTTDQVGQLLMQISSEAKRLELAKLSYARVADPANFGDVADLFNAQASKNQINQMVVTTTDQAVEENVYGYRTPLTTQQFNQLVRTVRNQYQDAGKYAVLRDAFNVQSNYFTIAQLQQLLPLITTESDRLALAKLSYARAADPSNFSSLYTLFSSQSSRDELANFVQYGSSASAQTGPTSNRVAMSDMDFSKLQMKVRLHFRQSSVVTDVREALNNQNNYFSTEQIRSLLGYVSAESDRLTLAKLAYHRATDPTGFAQVAADLFTTQASRDDMNNYIRTHSY